MKLKIKNTHASNFISVSKSISIMKENTLSEVSTNNWATIVADAKMFLPQ